MNLGSSSTYICNRKEGRSRKFSKANIRHVRPGNVEHSLENNEHQTQLIFKKVQVAFALLASQRSPATILTQI